jgi:hypothetical protein
MSCDECQKESRISNRVYQTKCRIFNVECHRLEFLRLSVSNSVISRPRAFV